VKYIYLALIAIVIIGFGGLYNNQQNVDNKTSNNEQQKQSIDMTNESEMIEQELKPEEVIGIEKWNKAPDFTLADSQDLEYQLSNYLGKKVIINFWTTWCPYCQKEMQEVKQYIEGIEGDDTIVLSINVTTKEKNADDIYKYVQNNQFPFPILLDLQGSVTRLYRVQAYPTNYFIDSKGVIREKIVGGLSLKDIKNIMSGLD